MTGMHFKFFFKAALLIAAIAPSTPYAATLDEIGALDDEARALELLDEFLRDNPGDVDGLLMKGVIYSRSGDFDHAVATFKELSTRHPNIAEPHNNLAVLYAAEKQYELARASLIKALEIKPNYDIAHENLGDIYAKLASLAYANAASLNPTNERAMRKFEHAEQILVEEGSDAPTNSTLSGASGAADSRQPAEGSAPQTASTSAPEPTAPPEALTRPVNVACWRITDFSGEDEVTAVQLWFESRPVEVRPGSSSSNRTVNYRVYLPPFPDRAGAQTAAGELKDKGIRDLLIIPRGDLKNGIDLGIYRYRQSADRRVSALRSIGFAAVAQPRTREHREYWLDINGDSGAGVKAEFLNYFPNHNPIDTECR